MSALAVAQPLLDILGSEPTFFVAHGADGWAVTRFALAVVLVPAAVVLAALFAARAVAQRLWRILVPATYGALAAATIVPAIDRSLHLRLRAFLPLTAVVAVGVGWAMWRWEIARSYARATVIGALVFPLLFLVSSPASGLVFPDTASGATSVSQAKNVMVVVFDELPLGALLDRDGTIDEVRFPGFARLADESTWYRNTTTVAPWTEIAVPALLTGRQPASEMVVPAEANHPHNLFRMLAGTHDLHAQEPLTQMCPRDRCDMVTEPPSASLYRDSATVYLHGLLPDSLAERWLPPIGDQWADFGGAAPGGPTPAPGREEWANSFFEQQDDDQVAIFEGFLDTVDQETSRIPQLWFDHLLVPHSPLIYLPTGEIYDEFTRPPGHAEDSWLEWGGDELLIEQARQRFVLQVKYIDQLVDQLLDTLERTGHDDDTLLVVASDHGIVFGPGAQRRGLTDHTADELLPVPLFVRYPSEPGRIDDEPRQIIDVLPTIVDVLGVDLPPDWQFDGRSLRELEGDAERAVTYPDVVRFTEGVDLTAAAAPYLAQFGTGRSEHDVYAWGPHADLVGSPAAPRTGVTADRPEVRIVTEGLQDVDPDSGFVPALVRLDLDAASVPDRWVAVAVNGTIAGLGLTWADPAQHTATVVIDPALLRAGTNRVEVFLVGPDGTLQPTTLVD